MVPGKMVHVYLISLLVLRNTEEAVSVPEKQTITKAATMIDNFITEEEGIPKIYLIFISPPDLSLSCDFF